MKKYKFYDPYYSPLLKNYPLEVIKKAGYIEEKHYNKNKNLYFLTPIPYNKKISDNDVLLLTTGSFAPLHNGHINLLKESKKYLESIGKRVFASYISPSHDKYVSEQKLKNSDYNIYRRIEFINDCIKSEKDIYLDLWESFGVNEPVNFTTVIEHLKLLYKNIYNKNIDVYYVFGSDNQNFELTFKNIGKGICIERDNYPIIIKKDLKNIIYIKNNKYKNLSSTKIRKYIKQNTFNDNDIYLIRNDFQRSIPFKVSTTEKNNYLENFIRKTKECLNNENVFYVNEKEENKVLKKLNIETEKTISLDLYHYPKNKIRVSRIFNGFSSQNKAEDITDIKNDISNIKEINTIFDDDSVSGQTIDMVQNKLNKDFEYKITLMENVKKEFYPKSEILDVIDIRDFIFGSKEGGLLINIYGKNIKFPYIFPFVNLTTRAKISYEKQIDFCLYIIDLNIKLFSKNNFLINDKYKYILKYLRNNNIQKEHITIQEFLLTLKKFLLEVKKNA